MNRSDNSRPEFDRSRVALLFATMVLLACLSDVRAADEPPKEGVLPVVRLVWQAPNRVDWRLSTGPFWSSMGHTSRVMCFIPVGVKKQGSRVVETLDGSGLVHTIRIEVHQVEEFEPESSIPKRTEILATKTIHASDEKALKRRNRWGFPHEQAMDFEFEMVPPMEHQTLARIFLHEDPQFWYTLMIHAEANIEELPAAMQSKEPARTKYFKKIVSHTVVCELLHDPTLKMTSTYIEPDDPPSTKWIEKERVVAPWAYGEGPLESVSGSLVMMKDGGMKFVPLSEEAKDAAKQLERHRAAAKNAALPRLSDADELDADLPTIDELDSL